MLPDLYNKKTFFTASGSAMAVWLFTTVMSSVFQMDVHKYKWIGLIVALVVSYVGALNTRRKLDLQLGTITFFNGLLIFVTASGIDSINQGVAISSPPKTTTAALIPFTDHASWWPTKTLVDSIAEQKKVNKSLDDENRRWRHAFKSVQDSCFAETFDKIEPMVVPKSSTVMAGAQYEADIFIAASDSKQKFEASADGRKLQISTDPNTGIMTGKVGFVATANTYDASGTMRKTFRAEIKLRDSTYRKDIEYTVVKPVVRITTGRISALYMNCSNDVNFEVPALGLSYNPTITAVGAFITKGSSPGRVTIVPNQRKVSVTIVNAGQKIETIDFEVKPIPRPRIVIRDNNDKEIDLKNGVRGAALTQIRVSAEPDENFRLELPLESIYEIQNMELILARGTQRVATINATAGNIDLNAWRSQFRPGDRIVVDVKALFRKTKSGEERVDIIDGTFNIPLQ